MSSRPQALSFAIMLIPAALLFCIGALADIDVPGVYMDAVNPDYLVVRVLHPEAMDNPVWIMPGNLIFDRFPVLSGSFYYGSLPFYLGLPVYALAGTGVFGIRLANMFFGLIVLVGAAAFLQAFRVRPILAALCLAMLALDPGFLFGFRTQYYITLLPIGAVFLSVALAQSQESATRWGALGAGVFAGIACYGYFIYLFLVPVLALHALWRWSKVPTRLGYWTAGFALGASPSVIGMALAFSDLGSAQEFWKFLTTGYKGLGVLNSVMTVEQRVQLFLDFLRGTILDVGPSLVMLQTVQPIYLSSLKIALLVGFPTIAFGVGMVRGSRPVGLAVIAGLILGFMILVLTFGNRLWFHHAGLLLPVLYVALALALQRFLDHIPPAWARGASGVAVVALSPFLVANAWDQHVVFEQLRATGGVGLASDAITRFAEESARFTNPTQMFFPDGGVFMSFVMITQGKIPYTIDFSPQAARAALCSGKDAEVVLVAGQSPERLADWKREVGWGEPEITTYRQHDGTAVLIASRWHASPMPAGACGG
ncbi:MAG TPA: hypothetical protein VLX09_10300 [Stellaceae bacterium]|nr:hypothetical protein [Stellaceae bacterium]